MNSGRIIRNYGLIILTSILFSCTKEKYSLLDPAGAGIWSHYGTGLPGNQVRGIALDYQGLMWVAFSGAGITSYDGINFTPYNTSNSGILSNSVTCLDVRSNGDLYIGTTDGISVRATDGSWYYFQDPVKVLYINAIKGKWDGLVIAGTSGYGFYTYDGTNMVQHYDISYKNVKAVEVDQSGYIWLGTDNGLFRWDGANFVHYTTSNGLPSNNITSLFCDSKLRLWIGPSGGTSAAWIDSGGQVHQMSLFTGTAGLYVRDIYEDQRGHIWFATWYDGLIEYDGVVPHSYKEYTGFPENDVNAAGQDKDGNMWFGLYSQGLEKYTLPLQ
jgi:ligand-binding sensor domain-containing protein